MSFYQRNQQTPVWIILGINFLVFIFTSFSAELEMSLALSLNSLAAKPWTIISSMFVHAGITHILFNMIALYFFGIFLIQMVGTRRFLLVYLVGGLVGNAVFLLFAHYSISASPYNYVVGASGAIYAIGGTMAILRPTLRIYMFFAIPMPLWVGIIIMFALTGFISNVAWQAHLGGLVFGVLAGLYFRRQYFRSRGLRW